LISISDALPESSNVKMVEVWMLFTLVLPFLEVVLQSYVDYIYRKSHPDEDETSRPPPAVRAEGKLQQPRRHGRINYIKTPNPICRLFFKTDLNDTLFQIGSVFQYSP
jgi:hypothetical protein